MTTEIATRSDEFDGLSAGMNQLVQYTRVLEVADEFARRLAQMTVAGPYRGKPQDALGAILYGAELGLNPVQSLQQVFTVHGVPAIYARTMVALLKNKGYRFKTESSTDESVTVSGIGPDGSTETSTWTIDRAVQAGYVPLPTEGSQRRPSVQDDWITVTKTFEGRSRKTVVGNMKYITDPQTMLWAKAAAEVCRRLAPDVLLGIAHTAEDLQSEPPKFVESERVTTPSGPVTAADILGATDDVRDDESVTEFKRAEAEKAAAATTPAPVKPERPEPAKDEPAAPAPAATQGAPSGDPITPLQLKKLQEKLAGVGLGGTTAKNLEESLAYINDIIRRKTPITAPKQLTIAESAKVSAAIDKAEGSES